MRIVIPAVHIKVFGKAIQSLAKIGEEISFEPSSTGLALKSINTTRSCLAIYELKPRFFQHFRCGPDQAGDESSVSTFTRFRITAKGVLNVFKSLNNMDKTVETCTISLDEEQNRVVFTLVCKHGITKTHSLTYMEAESLNCSLNKMNCSNILRAEHKLFTEILSSFPNNLEEMTMLVSATGVSFRNFVDVDVATDPMKVLSTTMTLDHEEFEFYQVDSESSLSFCVKEIKAAFLFAEHSNLNMALYFDNGGQPMFVNMDDDPNFEVTFVASTISESLSQQSNSSLNTTQTTNQQTTSARQTNNPPTRRPQNKKCLGKLEETSKPQAIATDARMSTVNSSMTTSTMIHDSTSEVKVKPRISALMDDTSITLLPTEKSSSKPKSEVDTLLDEITSETQMAATTSRTGKSLFFNRTKPAKRAMPEEVLADDSDDDG